MLENNSFDGIALVESLENEIKKLEQQKTTRKVAGKENRVVGITPIDAPVDAKCVAKTCSCKGLNTNNKAAVGVCAKCGNYEHFGCVKVKPDDRDNILKGSMKYFCSTCFSKNPSIAMNCNPGPKVSKAPSIITHS